MGMNPYGTLVKYGDFSVYNFLEIDVDVNHGDFLVCFTKRFAFVGIEKMTNSGMSIQRSCRLTTVFRGVAGSIESD